ncbi:Protein CBG00629 [Caenorhabditis briggsae]|uniref:Protein CBG00629 n=1 Tax=Caenorhabditis briggsae TaxID=6238 RepID=A8WNF0_CAEBR|nr:Protein CBG00629 [Caenorhabditis briggsae]CAP22004.1 Protein CBG00629 [Caenorhabditis briggsae]
MNFSSDSMKNRNQFRFLDLPIVVTRNVVSTKDPLDIFWLNLLEGRIKESVEWVKLRFPNVERIHINGPNVPQKDVQYVLDNITPTNKFRKTAESNENLLWRIEGTFEQIRIGSGSWITVDHAMNFSFPYVVVMGTTITNQELNLILKNWIDMKCHLKTKQLEINLMDGENFLDTVLENIPYEIGQPIVPL